MTWAVRVADIGEHVAAARRSGYDPGSPREMSRRTGSGVLLRWQLTYPGGAADGLVPFLIDWGDSAHPTTGVLPAVPLLSFTATHPEPEATRRALTAVGAQLPVRTGHRAALTVVLGGRHGPVTLTAAEPVE